MLNHFEVVRLSLLGDKDKVVASTVVVVVVIVVIVVIISVMRVEC